MRASFPFTLAAVVGMALFSGCAPFAGQAEADAWQKDLDERQAKNKACDEEQRREGTTSMFHRSRLYGEGVIEGTVIQIIDNENMVVSVAVANGRETGWLTGYPTAGYLDGEEFGGVHVIVDGRKQYDSAFGVRTVPLLKCITAHGSKKD